MTSPARLLARRTAAVSLVLIGLPWAGTVAGNALVGYPEAAQSVMEGKTATDWATPSPDRGGVAPRPEAPRASRSRSLTGTPAAGRRLDWAALRQCESGGDYTATSRTGKFRGAYQFSRSTWASVGGTGDPAAASPAEQDHRARLLYARDGHSPWPECGGLL